MQSNDAGVDSAPGRIKVMIVDDHAMVAESFRRVLASEHDMDVVSVVGSSSECHEVVATARPDVIIMDYRLPDGDGVAAAVAARAVLPDVKFLLLTGSGSSEALPSALDAGFAGYLEKTSAFERLAPAIRRAAAGELVLSADDLGRVFTARSAAADGLDLTRREVEILHLLAEGLTNKAIADRLTLSLNTVRKHVQSVLTKLDAHSKLEAVVIARRRGLIREP
ncbi:MAG TPA: response regulator transcription factor [Acidimicrobiales bacterium]|jgi:DNA-binding NarL/FixJ family response regulator|nr:response regulator transcription factor [Acidimicrobiales bacterium]